MQLRLPLVAFLLSSSLISVAEAAPVWVDGPPAQLLGTCTLEGASNPGATISVASYQADDVALTPKLGEVVWVRGGVANTACASTIVGLEFFLPQGSRLAAIPPVCTRRNSVTGGVDFPCGRAARTSTGGWMFTGFTTLEANTQKGGFNSLEVYVPLIFDQPFDAAFSIVSNVGVSSSQASVAMTVPYRAMPIMMIPGIMLPPPVLAQPTPSATALGDDLMLVGSALADAGTLPVAFSNDDGSFTVTNYPVGNFAARSREPNVTRLAGDFDHDGNLDVALVGGSSWNFIPVAMAQGDGSFHVTDFQVSDNFGALAASQNVKPVAGDFDGDGNTDIALVGGIGWSMVPIAFSQGDGTFRITFGSAGAFPTWAQATGARPIVGDFNSDRRSDIALVGGDGWTMLPHAYSAGDGSFTAHNAGSNGIGYRATGSYGVFNPITTYSAYSWNFAQTVNELGAQVVAADFNNDKTTDIAVTGTATSQGLRIAFSNGNGTWQLVEHYDPTWARWANTAGATVHVGDFNKDGWKDLALTGVSGWNQLPLALNAGSNSFSITLRGIGNFGSWAAMQGARVVVGDYNGDGFSDLAVTGVSGWTQIPVAMNTGNGFNILQRATNRFPAWSPDTSASLFVGRAN